MSETNTTNESVLDIFLLGLKTWLAEIRWLTKSILTRYEISRLEKELEQEYGTLGRIVEMGKGKKQDKELSLKQIDFLKEEIETLRSELARDREDRMAKLREES
ncbi:MAG: hypothetical protein OCC46_11410 [Pseudodesulfovibrio sp.]